MTFIEIIKGSGQPARINTEAITAVESDVTDRWTVIRLGERSYYTHESLVDFMARAGIETTPAPKGEQ